MTGEQMKALALKIEKSGWESLSWEELIAAAELGERQEASWRERLIQSIDRLTVQLMAANELLRRK